MRTLVSLAGLLVLPALAQAQEGNCRGQARSLEREMTLNADRMTAGERVQAEQRLSRADGLCAQDSRRASQDLEQLRRDMVLQTNRPRELPEVPPLTPNPGSGQ
ncbi:MAG: hypothetical protein NVV74_06860 [Magnetospirillum sp.]|nr:hypothetical protein [Magnetospirillum sp.]